MIPDDCLEGPVKTLPWVLLWNMKILLTADLHSNPDWLGWLEEEATKYGLVCIAGDLLDAFSKVAIQDQVAQVEGFLCRLAAKTRAAVCSGNHDAFELVQPLSPGSRSGLRGGLVRRTARSTRAHNGWANTASARTTGHYNNSLFQSGRAGRLAGRGRKRCEVHSRRPVALDRSRSGARSIGHLQSEAGLCSLRSLPRT
jgi:predicted MPP superfamily phosphohydrolase